jgi:hypothetical protein
MTEEKTEYKELEQASMRWFSPKPATIQHTVPSEPVKALQIEDVAQVVESALLHPFKTLERMECLLQDQNKYLCQLIDDDLIKRQFVDTTASLGSTVGYEIQYHRHAFVFVLCQSSIILNTNNGYQLRLTGNVWTNVSVPKGTILTVAGGNDQATIAMVFRATDFIMTDTSPLFNVIPVSQSGAWNVGSTSDYPSGSVPLTASSGNVASATATATLTGAAGVKTWVSGFEVTGSGATAGLPVSVTVTGTVSGTLTYTYSATVGVLLPNTPLVVEFTKAVPSSAVNTNIVVSCPSLGLGNTNNTVVAHGYLL